MNTGRKVRHCGAWVVLAVMLFAAHGLAAGAVPTEEVSEGAVAPAKDAPSVQAKIDEAEIARLIEQLGSDKFKEREAAQAALVAIGKPAEAQLGKALESSDPEIRARATRALAEIHKSGFERASDAIAKNVLWKLDVEQGISGSPVATATAVLFVSGDDKLRAVSAAKGKPLWDVPADPRWPLLVTDTTVYVRDGEGKLRAVDLKTGKPVAGFEPSKVAGPATIADGVIYVAESTENFVAVDARTGKGRWKVPLALKDAARQKLPQLGRHIEAQLGGRVRPVVAKGLVFVPTAAGEIVALDLRDGQETWTAPIGKAKVTSLRLCEGLLIARTPAVLRALDMAGKTKWELPLPGGQARVIMRQVMVIDGQKVVVSNDSAARSREIAIAKGMIYVTVGEQVVAVDAKEGKNRWSCDLKGDSAVKSDQTGRGQTVIMHGGTVAISVFSGAGTAGGTTGLTTSPAAGEAAVYVGGKEGLHAIDPKTRQQLWRLKTPQPVASTPVIRDGIIYFVTGTAGARRGDVNVRGALVGMGARLHAVRLKAKE